MSATKLDGTLYRDEIFSDLAQRVAALKDKGITPGLATVLVGVAAAVAGLHLAMRLIERPDRSDRPGGSGGPRSAVRRQASTGTHPVQSRDPREHTSPVRAARPRWRR